MASILKELKCALCKTLPKCDFLARPWKKADIEFSIYTWQLYGLRQVTETVVLIVWEKVKRHNVMVLFSCKYAVGTAIAAYSGCSYLEL